MNHGANLLELDGMQYGVKTKVCLNANVTRWRAVWCKVKIYSKCYATWFISSRFMLIQTPSHIWRLHTSHFLKLLSLTCESSCSLLVGGEISKGRILMILTSIQLAVF